MEPVVARFSAVVSLLTIVATYLAARSIGLSDWAAVASATLLALASPWLVYTKSFFAEPLLGLCMATAVWGLLTRRLALAGVSVSLAFLTKPPFLVVGVAWFAWLVAQGQRRDALRFLAIVGAMVVGTVLYNFVTTHQLVVSGALGWRWADGLSSLRTSLFSERYGLLLFTPWLVIGMVAGVLRALSGWRTSGPGDRGIDLRFGYPLLLAMSFYLLLVAMQASAGENCYGPRYWIPFMPWFALLTVAQAVESKHGWQKFCLYPAALATAALVIPATLQYYRVWDQPPQTGLLELWQHLV